MYIRIIFIFVKDEKAREIRKKKKMEDVIKTVAGQHGGKHFYEDEAYIESKKLTTEETIQSTQMAASKRNADIVAEKARRLEEERILQEKRDANGELSIESENFISNYPIFKVASPATNLEVTLKTNLCQRRLLL